MRSPSFSPTQTASRRSPASLKDETIPAWIVMGSWAFYPPDRILFEYQRSRRWLNGYPHLLDWHDTPYRQSLCECPRMEHLTGAIQVVTKAAILTLRHEPTLGKYGFVLSDGHKSIGVRLPKSAERIAAESLARAFSGEIVEGVEHGW